MGGSFFLAGPSSSSRKSATALMMVGVLTYPVEKSFLGDRVTVVRNIVSLLIALVVTGLYFGELL